MKKINLLYLLSILYFLFFVAGNVFAAGLVPDCASNGNICDYCDFLVMAQNIIKFLMTVGIPIVVIFIIYGAVMMMISAGDPQKATAGRKIITDAILGLAIALSAWIIVNTIFFVLAKPGAVPGGSWWKISCEPITNLKQ